MRKKKYNPLKYWEKRGKSYNAGDQAIAIPIDLMHKHIVENQVLNVLDIGSGWGRVWLFLQALGYIGLYSMCDIVDSMIENCKFLTGRKVEKIVDGVLPYSEKEMFDGVILCYVLQHVIPESIESFVNEVNRVSSRFVYIIDTSDVRQNARHCFSHDYEKLFSDRGFKLNKKYFCGGNVFLWVFEK